MTQCHQKISRYSYETLKADYELIRSNNPDNEALKPYDELTDEQRQFHADSYADYKAGLEKIAEALRTGMPLNALKIFDGVIKNENTEQ